MKKIDEERQKLLERLEEQKSLIKDDVQDLKEAASPKNMVRNLVADLARGLRENKSAADALKIAATMLPVRMPYKPVFYVALRYVLPYVLNNYPQIRQAASAVGFQSGVDSLRQRLPVIKKSTVLGTLKDGVSSLRRNLHDAQMRRYAKTLANHNSNNNGEVHHIGSFTAGSPY